MSKRSIRRRWSHAVDKWQRRLWLGHWDLNIVVERALKGKVIAGNVGKWDEAARAEYTPAYKSADIVLNGDVAEDTDAYMESRAAHELTHLLIGPYHILTGKAIEALPKSKRAAFEAWLEEVNEQVVSDVSRIFRYGVKRWKGE